MRMLISSVGELRAVQRKKDDVQHRGEIREAGHEGIVTQSPPIPDCLQGAQLHSQSRLSWAPQESQVRRPWRHPRRLSSPSRVSPPLGLWFGIRWFLSAVGCDSRSIWLFSYLRIDWSLQRLGMLFFSVKSCESNWLCVWLCHMLFDIWNWPRILCEAWRFPTADEHTAIMRGFRSWLNRMRNKKVHVFK